MEDRRPRWLYCCLTEARLAALASMAEFDLPGDMVWRGEPVIEAEIGLEVTRRSHTKPGTPGAVALLTRESAAALLLSLLWYFVSSLLG